jgi:hypothetical protein
MGIGGPLRHSCEALDSRRARQPLVDAKSCSRVLAAVVMDPSAEVRHPALGYDHGVVRDTCRLLELMPGISEGICDDG